MRNILIVITALWAGTALFAAERQVFRDAQGRNQGSLPAKIVPKHRILRGKLPYRIA